MPASKLRGMEIGAEVLRELWVKSHVNEAASSKVARIGRMRKAVHGTLTRLHAGDVVLVWDANADARTPLLSVWHPRNSIRTGVDPAIVEIVEP